MQHVWSLLCKKSVIDQDTNSLSVYDIIEQLSLAGSVDERFLEKIGKKEPVNVPYSFELISFWVKDDADDTNHATTTMIIELWGPEKKMSEFTQEVSMPPNTTRIRTRVKIDSIPVIGSGTYHFKVKEKGKRAPHAEIPFDILLNLKRPGETQ